jgi:hypothetical protein
LEGEFDAWIALEVEGEVVKVRCHAGFVGVQCGGWMVVTSHDEEERERELANQISWDALWFAGYGWMAFRARVDVGLWLDALAGKLASQRNPLIGIHHKGERIDCWRHQFARRNRTK